MLINTSVNLVTLVTLIKVNAQLRTALGGENDSLRAEIQNILAQNSQVPVQLSREKSQY